jgi:hypothetical protein
LILREARSRKARLPCQVWRRCRCPPVPSVWHEATGELLYDFFDRTPRRLINGAIDLYISLNSTPTPTRARKMQQEIDRNQAPKGVDRVDKGRGPYEKDHVHFGKGEDSVALNVGEQAHGASS